MALASVAMNWTLVQDKKQTSDHRSRLFVAIHKRVIFCDPEGIGCRKVGGDIHRSVEGRAERARIAHRAQSKPSPLSLGQGVENVAIFAHDPFGGFHLGSKGRVVGCQAKAAVREKRPTVPCCPPAPAWPAGQGGSRRGVVAGEW